MKHNIIRRVFFFSMLILALAAVASAQEGRTCSLAGVAGQWGTYGNGWLILPNGPVPVAGVTRFTRDAQGNFLGTETSVVGGKVSQYTLKGTTTIHSDCTGTRTYGKYDQSGNLVVTVEEALVWVDNETEARVVITSLVFANGTSVPAVITGNGKKLFIRHGSPQH
jgi:hypothetical protein